MTKEQLEKGQSLKGHIHGIEINLRDIKYYEDNYSDYPIRLRLKRTSNDTVFTDVEIYDEAVKKEILNLVKIHFIADIQKSEKELEEL